MSSLVAGAINIIYSKSTANCGKLCNVDMICLKDLLLVACHAGGSSLNGVNGDCQHGGVLWMSARAVAGRWPS